MATSSKVKFELSKLQALAILSIDQRIEQAELEVASYHDDEALAQRQAEWRKRQEERVENLHRQLQGEGTPIGDHQLSNFQIEDIPENDRWDRGRAERQLRELRSLKTQIEAKSSSLVADEDGSVALTKTQLKDFFAL